MFSCRYCGFNGETAIISDEDPERFLSSLLLWVSEKVYKLRLLVETRRDGSTVTVGVRPCGAITETRRRAWGKLRDEIFLGGVVAGGIVVLPEVIDRAWDKWPMVTLTAQVQCPQAQS